MYTKPGFTESKIGYFYWCILPMSYKLHHWKSIWRFLKDHFLYESVREDWMFCVLLIWISHPNNTVYWVAGILLTLPYCNISGSKGLLSVLSHLIWPTERIADEIDKVVLSSCSGQNDLLWDWQKYSSAFTMSTEYVLRCLCHEKCGGRDCRTKTIHHHQWQWTRVISNEATLWRQTSAIWCWE